MLTIGVEEEFLLLAPNGALAPVANEVVRASPADGQITREFMAYQVETATRVCTDLDELRAELVRLRLLAAGAAERFGAHLVAAGMPPYRLGAVGAVTADARYLEIARRFPTATLAAGGACACQVHIGIPDRQLRVQLLTRLRPWLPTLLALTANSAVVNGVDTGWNSYRYRALLHWPTFRAPGVWPTAGSYADTVRSLIDIGAAVGEAGIYFLARLSPRYPTIEVRVADACLTVDDTVLFAALVRGLVAMLLDEDRRGHLVEPATSRQINVGLLHAAHRGAAGLGNRLQLDFDARLRQLQNRITPALAALGDTEEVQDGLQRLGRLGTGAERQRALLTRAANPHAFVASLAQASVPAVSAF